MFRRSVYFLKLASNSFSSGHGIPNAPGQRIFLPVSYDSARSTRSITDEDAGRRRNQIRMTVGDQHLSLRREGLCLCRFVDRINVFRRSCPYSFLPKLNERRF